MTLDVRQVEILEQVVKHGLADIKLLQEDMKEANKQIAELQRKIILIDSHIKQSEATMTSLHHQISLMREDLRDDKKATRTREDYDIQVRLNQYEEAETSAQNRWYGLLFVIIGGIVLAYMGLN